LFGSVSTSVQPAWQQLWSPTQLGPPLQPIMMTMHWPPSHSVSGPHWTLQPPQLFGSLSRLVQMAPQHDSPTAQTQVVMPSQTPLTQLSSGAHAVSQFPQNAFDVCRFAQMSPQHESPGMQPPPSQPVGGWQALPRQLSPGGHTLLQNPQLSGSLTVSMQPPSQHERPFVQA
jgi:hypothetical protein